MDNKNKTCVVHSTIASIGAAIITKTSTNPLERIKVLQQVRAHYDVKLYNNIICSFKDIRKQEQFRGLFKGNLINICRVTPAYILKFNLNTTFNTIFVDSQKEPQYYHYAASGMSTGVSQIFITYPLETIRTLRTLDNNMFKNNTLSKCVYNIYNNYGIKGFYTGLPISLLAGGAYTGTQFSVYNYLKYYYTNNTFIAGATAGIIAQTVFYWGDCIKRNLHANIVKKKYSGTFDCFKQLGIKKLYAGYRVNLFKCIIESPLQFYIYENIIKILNN